MDIPMKKAMNGLTQSQKLFECEYMYRMYAIGFEEGDIVSLGYGNVHIAAWTERLLTRLCARGQNHLAYQIKHTLQHYAIDLDGLHLTDKNYILILEGVYRALQTLRDTWTDEEKEALRYLYEIRATSE